MSPQYFCEKCDSTVYGREMKCCLVCCQRDICEQFAFRMYLKAIYHLQIPYDILCFIARCAIGKKENLPLIHEIVWKTYNHGTINIPYFRTQTSQIVTHKYWHYEYLHNKKQMDPWKLITSKYISLEDHRMLIKYNNHPYDYNNSDREEESLNKNLRNIRIPDISFVS
jgi:hypothetical protein